MESVFKVNVVAVQYVIRALLPLLKKGDSKKIMNMYVFDEHALSLCDSIMLMHERSSPSGSIGLAATFERFKQRAPAYQISKAALNRLTAQYAVEYAEEGFLVLAVSPGVSLLLRDTYLAG